jgi:hypothetical protein
VSTKVPLTGLPLLVHKLRAGGLPWLMARVRDELQMPRTVAGQGVFRTLRGIGRSLGRGARRARQTLPGDILYAFYDLGVAPVTYDFLWFLVGAELARERLGLASIHAVIVPGPHEGVRKENPEVEGHMDPAARRARIGTVLVPACALLPSVAGVTVATSRAEAARLLEITGGAVFPARYEPALPSYPGPREALHLARESGRPVGVLRATATDLRAVDAWLAAHGCTRPVITITLRGYDYVPARNSNVAAWAEFAQRLDRTRFSPVIVPDTAQSFGGVPAGFHGLPVFGEATVAVGLRMALYERAYLNLGVNNGPMGLCWLNDRTRYITFKILSEAAAQTTPEYMEFLGFEIGKSLPFATPWQRWVWEEDTLEVIEGAVAEMTSRLDAVGRKSEA